ncbi:unnamed protein product [Clavelina lepadiformis]|uniref:Uncharacterized protein n=1 Tax=Clavelina lepadiformis TaxID=159417 RepID=A0ABP0G705_CLALP
MPLLVDFLKSPIRSCLTSYHETVSQNIQSHSFHNSGGKESVLPTSARSCCQHCSRSFGKKKTALESRRKRECSRIELSTQLNSGGWKSTPGTLVERDCFGNSVNNEASPATRTEKRLLRNLTRRQRRWSGKFGVNDSASRTLVVTRLLKDFGRNTTALKINSGAKEAAQDLRKKRDWNLTWEDSPEL